MLENDEYLKNYTLAFITINNENLQYCCKRNLQGHGRERKGRSPTSLVEIYVRCGVRLHITQITLSLITKFMKENT